MASSLKMIECCVKLNSRKYMFFLAFPCSVTWRIKQHPYVSIRTLDYDLGEKAMLPILVKVW